MESFTQAFRKANFKNRLNYEMVYFHFKTIMKGKQEENVGERKAKDTWTLQNHNMQMRLKSEKLHPAQEDCWLEEMAVCN